MKVKYYDKETFDVIDDYKVMNESRVRLIYSGALENNSGFDIYEDDEETLLLSCPMNTVLYDSDDDFVEYTVDTNIYCIHYLYNEDGYIVDWLRSIDDFVENGIFIKKGQGKEYAEDEPDIEFYDEEGFYNYKVVDGEMIEVTEDEKAVMRKEKVVKEQEEAKITFETNRENKVNKSKLLLSAYLESHPLVSDCHGGVEAEYNVTSEKQSLMASNYLTYTIAKTSGMDVKLTWNASGCECEEWTEEEYVTLVLQISEYVKPLVSLQQSYEVEIRKCTTQEELDAIEITYDVYGVAENEQ